MPKLKISCSGMEGRGSAGPAAKVGSQSLVLVAESYWNQSVLKYTVKKLALSYGKTATFSGG